MKSIEQEMLDLVDVEGLREIVYKLGHISKVENPINIEQYLERWAQNKKHIYEAFGNKLKLEEEVEIDLSINKSLIKSLITNFRRKYEYSTHKNMFKLISGLTVEEVANNTLNKARVVGKISARPGDKISKVLGKVLVEDGVSNAEKDAIQTDFSMLIQELTAKGVAVISIDPIDYFTMSENNSNWQSCHALGGCYRTGTISYLQDPTSTISYVKPKTDIEVHYGDNKVITYSNKTWRQIVLFSSKLTYATQLRQYPNYNSANCETVGKMTIKVLEQLNGVKYKIDTKNAECGEQSFIRMHNCYESGRYCYNDLTHEAFEYCYWIHPADEDSFDYSKYHDTQDYCRVGTIVKCLCGCGRETGHSETLFFSTECIRTGTPRELQETFSAPEPVQFMFTNDDLVVRPIIRGGLGNLNITTITEEISEAITALCEEMSHNMI